jgi:uncharacterized membrane protein YdbT with pleckstrin-like domain
MSTKFWKDFAIGSTIMIAMLAMAAGIIFAILFAIKIGGAVGGVAMLAFVMVFVGGFVFAITAPK